MAHWKAVTEPARPRAQALPDAHRLDARLRRAVDRRSRSSLLLLSASVLDDSLTAIGFPICFYYGFTGIACAWYYRHELIKSARNFLLLGLGPLLGGLMLFGIGVKAAFYYGHEENVDSAPIARHHAAAVVRHRRHDPRRDHHDRLAAVLQRVLLPQDRNRATGPARQTAADRTRARAGGVLRPGGTPPVTGNTAHTFRAVEGPRVRRVTGGIGQTPST